MTAKIPVNAFANVKVIIREGGVTETVTCPVCRTYVRIIFGQECCRCT